MIPSGKQYKVGFLVAVISLLIVGCAPSQEIARENVIIAEQDSMTKSSPKQVVSSPTEKDLPSSTSDELNQPEQPEQPEQGHDEATPLVEVKQPNEDVVVADEQESKNTSKDIYNVTDAYDSSNPTLMGFTMKSHMNNVIERFGKPLSESVMIDGSEPLQIYEYPGFIFGFNSADRIVFIEVNSSEVNPGLNNLHVGQSVEEARTSLGTPDSLNEYVMIYSNNNLIMKLDIDPNSSIIRSIKLFAE